MSEAELKKFGHDLEHDPELSGEMELHRLIDNTLEQHDEVRFRQKLKEIFIVWSSASHGDIENSGPPRLRKLHRRVIYILPALAVAGLLIFLLNIEQRLSPGEIYDRYYDHYTQDVYSRSNHRGTSNLLSLGVYYYREDRFSEADSALTAFLAHESMNVTALFYRGLSEMALSNFEAARKDLLAVSNGDFSYYQEHSRWYLGLCFLKTGHTDDAEALFRGLREHNSIYAKPSSKILDYLPHHK